MTIDTYLAFGSNLGEKLAAIRTGIALLDERGVKQTALSGLFGSKPKYRTDQPDYINCVGRFTTSIDARELLEVCNAAERAAGRRRRGRHGPRELDVDILLYGKEVFSEEDLTIPHPGIPDRLFVLVPLAELAESLDVPGMGKVGHLLAEARKTLHELEEVVSFGPLPVEGEIEK